MIEYKLQFAKAGWVCSETRQNIRLRGSTPMGCKVQTLGPFKGNVKVAQVALAKSAIQTDYSSSNPSCQWQFKLSKWFFRKTILAPFDFSVFIVLIQFWNRWVYILIFLLFGTPLWNLTSVYSLLLFLAKNFECSSLILKNVFIFLQVFQFFKDLNLYVPI